MPTVQRIVWRANHTRLRGLCGLAIVCCMFVSANGQSQVPLADRVDQALLPSGISESSVHLDGRMVHVFKDHDGTDALSFIGGFSLNLGDGDDQTLRSRDAIVWISHREYEGRPYRHLQILLWRDAEIREIGGTVTNGPALMVTLSTYGEIQLGADEVAHRAPIRSQIYEEGNRIRQAIAAASDRSQETTVSFGIIDASGFSRANDANRPAKRAVMQFRSGGTFKIREMDDGRQVLTVTGGIYLSRGVAGSGDYLEVQADSAVVYLADGRRATVQRTSETGLGRESTEGGGNDKPVGAIESAPDANASGDQQLMSSAFGDMAIESVYLEGDVRMTQGPNMVRASRLYYDLLGDRAVILDAVVRTTLLERNVPLYLRAAEIRQLSRREFAASDAVVTTSEFHTPHYHIGARRVELTDRTTREPGSETRGISAGTITIRHATFNLGGTPIAYWPFLRVGVDASETGNRSIRTGFSNEFGLEFETDWHLFNAMGYEEPEGFDSTLSLDFYSKRGPAAGIDVSYKRDRYFGDLRTYVLSDDDRDFLGREREELSRREVRGRYLHRHRQYLADDWELTFELSYISDRGFLEEFFESEFDKDKEQETLFYLKRQRDNWAFTAQAQGRILDFTTQTERLPELTYRVIGEPLGDSATLHSVTRAGVVRYRPADQTFRELLRDGRTTGSGSVVRVDSRYEVGAPLELGPWRFVAFATYRSTTWDDSPVGGGIGRTFGTYGVRGSMYLWRVDPDVRSLLLDLDGLRHIIKPEIIAWMSHTNRDADELFPFDENIETLDEIDGVTIGIRQRWQTKRGDKERRRTVDVFTLHTQAGVFNDAPGTAVTNGFTSFSRPENSIARNYLNNTLIWRINDRTALLSEVNYDLNDGEVDILNISLAVERTPRFSYLLGYRFIEESDSNLFGLDLNYRLTEKHTLAIREAFDLEQGRTLDFTVALIRKFPRWFGAISFALDEAEDDFGVSISFWPEGLPEAALGSRRFTALGQTTRLEND